MNLRWCAVTLLAGATFAQPVPEECLAVGNDLIVETASYRGREYRFKRSGCKAEFDRDPERFSQLYDALLEMHAAGATVVPPSPSLVPG